ncbi:unnamed protein product [Protopolystoma xenopodis]|uniref:Uncharacterized protein n=1 Tax=Protopolystoma xenopodis TaxID=117903 RepID=A0A3S5AXA7_9PLAT|nr:unnamed protein product [Protopolystoma xenopodis]
MPSAGQIYRRLVCCRVVMADPTAGPIRTKSRRPRRQDAQSNGQQTEDQLAQGFGMSGQERSSWHRFTRSEHDMADLRPVFCMTSHVASVSAIAALSWPHSAHSRGQ